MLAGAAGSWSSTGTLLLLLSLLCVTSMLCTPAKEGHRSERKQMFCMYMVPGSFPGIPNLKGPLAASQSSLYSDRWTYPYKWKHLMFTTCRDSVLRVAATESLNWTLCRVENEFAVYHKNEFQSFTGNSLK